MNITFGKRLFCGLFAGLLCSGMLSTAHADLLEDIKTRGEIVIGTEARFPPFEFVKDGKIVGYSSDLLALIMQDMPEVKVKQMDIPWQGILPGLSARKFDFIVTSVTATKERSERYALSLPIADATVAMLVQKKSPFTTPESLSGMVVGSQTGSAQLQALHALNEKLKASGAKPVTIKEYVGFDEAYADLAAGRLQGVAQSFSSLSDAVQKRPEIFRIITPPFGPKVYFCWAARNDADSASLAAFFNDGLRKLNTSGKMKELQEKWFGFSMEVPSDTLPDPIQ